MWFDRVTGRALKALPEVIESSRFVASADVLINGHTPLVAGSLLVDDGSGRFLGEHESAFYVEDDIPSQDVEGDVVISALREFDDATKQGRGRSFLLPEKLLNWLHLSSLDEAILHVVGKGHLQEIVRAPKVDMVYQENFLPVSRVKRIPASATRHLAAHSECWQKRSFSGVVPKTLLALESEDEFNIYENRVFARLLDHLERYLQRRCSEVACIEDAITKRKKLDGAGVYWETRERICSLWGEGFSSSDVAQEEATQGQDTLAILRSLLRTIRGLRESRLYRAIPPKDDIGFQIRMTNTLTHDQHYRHIARLWHEWNEFSRTGRLDPKVLFQQKLANAASYFTYSKGLIFRGLEELGYANSGERFTAAGRKDISVVWECSNLTLKCAESSITFVPMLSAIAKVPSFPSANSDQVVILSPDISSFDLSIPYQTASPLYFYTLEAMVSRLSSWLTRQAVSVMDFKLDKLPSNVLNLIGEKYSDVFELKKYDAFLRYPLGSYLATIQRSLSSLALGSPTNELISKLEDYSADMDLLLACPVCRSVASKSDYSVRDERGFEVIASNCDHTWKINKNSTSNRFLVVSPKSDRGKALGDEDEFFRFGRYKWSVKLAGSHAG